MAKNSARLGPDLTGVIGTTFDVRFSLIGNNANSGLTATPSGVPDAKGNLIGGPVNGLIDPKLGALDDNGGSTLTHALLAGSPALNMGNPAAVAGVGGVPQFDQRGAPFGRVFGGRIDIGAYEQSSLNLVVDTLADESDGNYGPGDLSLREAISLTKGSFDPATITFAPALTSGGPATIHLTRGELGIRDAVSIVGPGQNLLTIDAAGNDPTPDENNGDGSRIFTVNSTPAQIDVSISGLTLTGGDVSGVGGAILSTENTTVTLSTISGNSAVSSGGGFFSTSGDVTVTNSTISDNSAGVDGGGIFSFNVGNATVTDSTISGNSAVGSGGGIANYSSINTTVTNSTISGNSAGLRGGGIFNGSYFKLTLTSSTITNNEAPDGQGSGVASDGNAPTRTEVQSSIIAGNVRSDVDFVNGATNSFQSNGYNLIGTGNATGAYIELGDQTGVADPLLGPLADNGGPTLTHALLTGSPAIDAGDPAAVAGMNGVPAFDQRGTPFGRMLNGDAIPGARIDIGAFELPPIPLAFFGDYNHNSIVDAADYTVWRDKLGSNVTAYSGADGSGNGVVDQADYGVWKAHFGMTLPAPGAGSAATLVTAPAQPVTQLAIAASQPSALPGGGAAAALADNVAPSDSRPVAAANALPARSARGAAPPSDAVFTLLGQRTPARSMAARTVLRSAAVDTAVSDSLLLVRPRHASPTTVDDSARAADQALEDTDTRGEWTDDVVEKWRTAERGLTDFAPFVV